MRSKHLATVMAVVLVLAFALPGHAREDEPDKVTVQHILIGFKRSVPGGEKLDRTRKEAKALAEDLARRAREGEDFDALVKEYTNDQVPGIYVLTNTGANQVAGGRKRGDMVPKFGDVAFSLEVGEVGVAPHHAALSPYGWHVIKRLE